MNQTKIFTLRERVLSLALLALDTLQDAPTPDGFAGVMFAMLKKTTDKNPKFLSDMISKQLSAISDEQLHQYILRLRDEIIPYLLDDHDGADQNS